MYVDCEILFEQINNYHLKNFYLSQKIIIKKCDFYERRMITFITWININLCGKQYIKEIGNQTSGCRNMENIMHYHTSMFHTLRYTPLRITFKIVVHIIRL